MSGGSESATSMPEVGDREQGFRLSQEAPRVQHPPSTALKSWKRLKYAKNMLKIKAVSDSLSLF